ncbi:MAG: FAD-dependent monooxygenase [Gemmatimonadota bacterium]|jgi:flavin-dependent dehydrogenase
MRDRADIAVVGAGPAGARAAELLASRGARVVLLDPKVPWEKPCGGGLTPPAFREIPELEELKSLARPVTSVRVQVGRDVGFTLPLAQPMWVLSRTTLGEWQLDRALSAGAEHLPVRVNAIRRAYGTWNLDTSGGELTVPALVGADGAASLVRRAVAPKFRVELAPTRVAYPPKAGPTPDTAILRFYRGIAGYLWDFPRPDHRSWGIMTPRGTWRRPRMDAEIDEYRASVDREVRRRLERAGAVIGTAQFGHGDYSRIAGRDFALLGDAAGFADPFTGEGIQNAMRSASLLAEAWRQDGFAAYPDLARRAFEREFQVARMLRRSLFEEGVGVRLAQKAALSAPWYAVVAAVVNGMVDHDGRARRLLEYWSRAYRSVRRRE